MYVAIEVRESWQAKKNYVVEKDCNSTNSAIIKYEINGSDKKAKAIKKKIPLEEYQKIIDEFYVLDFNKIFKENPDNIGLDGWEFKCSLVDGWNEISVSLWSPSKDDSKPETAKLLESCRNVFERFKDRWFDGYEI